MRDSPQQPKIIIGFAPGTVILLIVYKPAGECQALLVGLAAQFLQ
jgi:hypothetical protein